MASRFPLMSAAVPRAADRSQRSLAWRIGWGVALGAVAFVINLATFPVLSPESPEFAFGGTLVMFAFRTLGPVAGLLTTVIGFAAPRAVPEATVAAIVIYAIEGYVVSRLMRRNLVVTDTLFWLTVGALLDAVAYRWWIGLAPGYVLLLHFKQLLNGVVNSALAMQLMRSPFIRRRLLAPELPPRAWSDIMFERTASVVMVPVAIIALLLARASHEAHLSRTAAELRQSAASAQAAASQFLQARLASIVELQMAISAAGNPSADRTAATLRQFLSTHPEFVNVFVTNARGIVQAAAPEASMTGVPNRGYDVSVRPYFAAVRASRRPVFGELVLGQLHERHPGVEPILPLVAPRIDAHTAFDGVVLGALDVVSLRSILAARVGSQEGSVQLLDHRGRVVSSTSADWVPGASRLADLEAVEASGGPHVIPPASAVSRSDRLGVSPRITIAEAVLSSPFTIVADEPMSAVHRAMIPTSLALIALMLVGVLSIYRVSRTLGAQLAGPLQTVGAVAEDLAGCSPVPGEVLDRFGKSPIREIRLLGAQFFRMDDALRARHDADATAVRASESRYRETLEQLAQAQKMEGIGRLAGGIAHDFNNLLTPIVGYTDLALASVPPNSPARRDLALVRTAAGRAKEVVAQLLAFGRAQVLDTQRLDLAEIVAEFEPLLRKSLRVNQELALTVEPGIEVEADRAKVQQVLMNLVLNAADAMPMGGTVEVQVGIEDNPQPDRADPEPLAAGRYGVIVVKDTGVGMDEVTIRRVFDPFFTTKPRGKGTGLGLSTAYGIVRQHRGTILVESAPAQGTRVRVLLPVATPVPHIVRDAPPRPEVLLTPAAKSEDGAATLLVVEDETAVRELVRTALVRCGYRVLAARDGEEALTRAAAHAGRIDLLLTDVVMPGLNGRELAMRFRQSRPNSRVLFMSGYAADVISDEGALAGDANLLMKPFTPDELEERVRKALEER